MGKKVSSREWATRDHEFMEGLPFSLRAHASESCTPFEMIHAASDFLTERRPGVTKHRILDLGAGVGKFCIYAAIRHPKTRFTGAELDEVRYAEAQSRAKDLQLKNLKILNKNVFGLDWKKFTGLYFFNPFEEQLRQVTSVARLLVRDETIRRLQLLSKGTRVVTFCGAGCKMPKQLRELPQNLVKGPFSNALKFYEVW